MKPSMDQLLVDIQQVAAELPPEEVRGCLVKLAAVQTVVATRLPTTMSVTSARASDLAAMQLLTVADCAQLTKLTTQFVYEAIRKGELKAARIGEKQLRVRSSDLENWIWGKGVAMANQQSCRRERRDRDGLHPKMER